MTTCPRECGECSLWNHAPIFKDIVNGVETRVGWCLHMESYRSERYAACIWSTLFHTCLIIEEERAQAKYHG